MRFFAINMIFLTMLIALTSCSDKKDFETYINHLGIDFSDSYDIDSITQIGFTDWTLKAYLRISDNDKNRILAKIKAKTKFPVVFVEKEYYDTYYQEGASIHGFIIGTKYNYGKSEIRYEKIKGKAEVAGYQIYDIELDTVNNKLFFKYEYE